MIRVVQISTTESFGGAALAAQRLHRALNLHGGVESTYYVALAQEHGDRVVEYNPAAPLPSLVGKFLFRVARRIQGHVKTIAGPPFSQDWTVFGTLPAAQMPAVDLHHLHWTANFVDFRLVTALARRGPVVWTLHDMNPFTGGCHYDNDCGRFLERCGCCPILQQPSPNDASSKVLRRKLEVLAPVPDDAITLVCPSGWMASESRRSRVLSRFATRVIPNGIDLEVFRPVADREAVRRRLGLAPEDRAVLFVAEILDDSRKGRRELELALAEVARRRPELRVLTMGRGDLSGLSGPAYRHLGRLFDAAAIRDAYAAADIFVIPSLQDNFPNTVIEAMACGTPVAGFATGGVSDAVEDGRSGLLAPTGDVARLAEAIVTLMSDDARCAAMGKAARARAEERYGLITQATALRALYEELLGREQTEAPRISPLEAVKQAVGPLA